MVQSSECLTFHVSKLLKIPKLEKTFKNSEGEDKQSWNNLTNDSLALVLSYYLSQSAV